MDESNKAVLRVHFDHSVKLEFQGAKITGTGEFNL